MKQILCVLTLLILTGCAAVKTNSGTQAMAAPIAGNPRGTVTIVEYYDYACPHCHIEQVTLDEILATNPNVRLVYRVYPILGPSSWYAARASDAALIQGKFIAFHEAVMGMNKPPLPADIDAIAQSIGLDMQQYRNDLASTAVTQAIDKNIASVGGLNQDTPLIFVGSRTTVHPVIFKGETDFSTLQAAIQTMSSGSE